MFKKFMTLFSTEISRIFKKGLGHGYLVVNSILLFLIGFTAYVLSAGKLSDMPLNRTSLAIFTALLMFGFIWLLFLTTNRAASDMFAGDKQRKTLSQLLITPVSGTTIATSKLTALVVLALCSALVFSGGFLYDTLPAVSAEAICLFLVVLTTALLIVSFSAVISIVSEDAEGVASALKVIGFLVALSTFLPLLEGSYAHFGWRFVPVFNMILTTGDLMLRQASALNITITCVSNIVYALALVAMLIKMFKGETYTLKKDTLCK